jgi:hypothetical protein
VFATGRVLAFGAGGTVLVVGVGWRVGNRSAALPPGLWVGLGAGMPGRLPTGRLPAGTLPGGTLPGGTLPAGTLPGGTLPGGTLGRLPTGSGEVTTFGGDGSFATFCAAAVGGVAAVGGGGAVGGAAAVGGGGAVTETLADAWGAVAR